MGFAVSEEQKRRPCDGTLVRHGERHQGDWQGPDSVELWANRRNLDFVLTKETSQKERMGGDFPARGI